ncbi:MAG: hypothetical protein COS30_01010 [Candidatus Portnoybacteria bacterium CG02_land_8_20_14_3_00_45_8]|uniref:HypC/HybG/HupF family hydrogenase formation chaperone n=1 Tax=Candidatus Portnoybacteria bacterium CG02_land_8_20_14_3_00_45_8 TaxID=1974807 RepID=A0A2M7D6I0_9BACT|nr:MAG: hypothetical protein COS30_01010 [Candidatus Portnoybacteria bacterium CG02_land_8_20_14_3_00_45_8]
MCLTIPKQIIAIKNDLIKVRSGKKIESVGSLVKVKKGDWVLTQNSIIIRKITPKQARDINQIILTS